jgi:hypothetical protein
MLAQASGSCRPFCKARKDAAVVIRTARDIPLHRVLRVHGVVSKHAASERCSAPRSPNVSASARRDSIETNARRCNRRIRLPVLINRSDERPEWEVRFPRLAMARKVSRRTEMMDGISWPAIPRWRVETHCADVDRWRARESFVPHRPQPRSPSLTRRSLRTWLQRHLGAHESRETSNGLL